MTLNHATSGNVWFEEDYVNEEQRDLARSELGFFENYKTYENGVKAKAIFVRSPKNTLEKRGYYKY